MKKIFVILLVAVVLFFGIKHWQNERLLKQAEEARDKATVRLTFIEGWTLRDYADYLKQQGVITNNQEFFDAVGEPAVDYRHDRLPVALDFLAPFSFLQDKPEYATLEGYLFPDTYFFVKGTAIENLVKKMLNNFEGKLTAEMRAEIKKQNKTIFEIVTVASLAEAEAQTTEDRALVADIIYRRLASGMPLQLDSTVNYVTGEKNPAISLTQQKIDSPYNTYKYKNLPLGPISNPSLDSLQAAIYPQKNNYWFFLTGTDGRMHYAKNLAGHQANMVKYLK